MEKEAHEKFCQECGKIINIRAEICPSCGIRVLPLPTGNSSKIVAALLAFFLGGIGIHKFYLRQPGSGIVYLLLCWTLIPGIIAFIEGLIFLTMSDEAFDQKYGVSSGQQTGANNITTRNVIGVVLLILVGIFLLVITGDISENKIGTYASNSLTYEKA